MTYYEKIKTFQELLKEFSQNIFRTYGRELVLRLEEYNLLEHKGNAIESSTAFGFIIEEFLVAKLHMYTHSFESEVEINRLEDAKAKVSYDCFSIFRGVRFLINIKTEKRYGQNNGIAAINQLYNNYCSTNPELEKAFVILKVQYSVRESNEGDILHKGKPRHIYIDGIDIYNLEEIDFDQGYTQDHRSWSAITSEKGTQKQSGRLQITSKDRQTKLLAPERVSYQSTFRMIEAMFQPD